MVPRNNAQIPFQKREKKSDRSALSKPLDWAMPRVPRFLFSVATPDKIPPFRAPEVAFFGASNVGKSTLINALCQKKSLAKTSKSPGCTRLLNFFSFPPKRSGGLERPALTLVDVPGYGFAALPPSVRQNWETLLLAYLTSRQGFLSPYVLLDARRGVRDHDRRLMTLLAQNALMPTLVLTKMDKLTRAEAEALVPAVRAALPEAAECAILCVSSKNRDGVDTLRAHLFETRKGASADA